MVGEFYIYKSYAFPFIQTLHILFIQHKKILQHFQYSLAAANLTSS